MKKPKLLLYGIDGAQNNYVLDMVNRGKLPGFARLMREGVYFSDIMSTFPTISPTCWNSVFTGAVPKVHGAVCQDLHYKTAHPGEVHSSYQSEYITAERFWETAGRKGLRSLVIDTLGAGHVKAPNVTHIRGGVGTKPSQIPNYVCNIQISGDSAKYISGKKIASDKWTDFEKENNPSANTFILKHKHNGKVVEDAFTWTVKITDEGLKIGCDESAADSAAPIQLHQWTDVMSRSLMTVDGTPAKFHFRAYFMGFDAENNIYTILVTGAYNILLEMDPADKAAEIAEIPEINVLCGDTIEMFADTLGFYSQWKAKSLNGLWKAKIMILLSYIPTHSIL
ncbi:MAG: alkaline phosphatase family protein [Clostridia bacterium]|nr:alkaline phosphatase family protein [Clostridia bacterium]